MNKISKSIFGLATVAATVASTIASVPVAEVSAYGDNSANGRTAYTMKSVETANFGGKAVFNSITDNSAFGNEFNFVGARKDGASTTEPDEITIEDGQTYILRLYYHNNNKNVEATNVQARFKLPTAAGKSLTVMGYLTADNANPTEYWDHVVFKSSDNFYLEYVEGSALLQNNGIGVNGGAKLSDDVMSKGVKIGYNALDGKVPGCYEYDGSVIVKVVAKKVNYEFNKTVRIAGTNDEFTESVNAKVGDKVEFKIHFKNNSNSKANDVTIFDKLPENLKYVGYTTITNPKYTNQILSGHVVDGDGVHIGNYNSGSAADVFFTAEVTGDVKCGTSVVRTNTASLTFGTNDAVSAKDTASVKVNGAVCEKDEPTPTEPEPEEPKPAENIPQAGPAEIITGTLGAGSIVTALGYFIASRKKLM